MKKNLFLLNQNQEREKNGAITFGQLAISCTNQKSNDEKGANPGEWV
jgi:hypothetical protein